MKIAGSLWWRFDERLRDAGGIARESERWAMDGERRWCQGRSFERFAVVDVAQLVERERLRQSSGLSHEA